MLTFDEARRTADHLRARTEVERAPLASFLVLLSAAALQAFAATPASLAWSLGLLLWMVLGPVLVNRLLPGRNLMGFRLALVAYPLNALLLALVVYLQIAGWNFVPFEDLPALTRLLPWSGVVAGVMYAILQAPHWMRRVGLYAELAKALETPVAPEAVAELRLLMDQSEAGEGACFRSVPATPKDWSRFLKLDTQTHGFWRVAFAPLYAVLWFEDGARLEAVPKKGLKLVAEDLPEDGRAGVCLIRWNTHLLEGRITAEDFRRITAWNQSMEGLGPAPEA